jgi:putative addiction module component (TIGR02574 family)
MSPDLKQCETQALSLTPKERAILAQRLIESLDALNESENEGLWIEEAERRYKEYKAGNISARFAEESLREARLAIK